LAVDQPIDEVAVAHDIELEPEGSVGVPRHVLDGADAHCRQRERDAGARGGAGGEDFAVGMLHSGHAGGRDRDGHADRLADHGRRQRSVGHIDGDALAQLDPFEVG
jgi:hypothetical protein